MVCPASRFAALCLPTFDMYTDTKIDRHRQRRETGREETGIYRLPGITVFNKTLMT